MPKHYHLCSFCIVIGLFQNLPDLRAQETTYVSNLDRLIIGSLPVASDAWISTYFLTGNSPAGYKLNSIQLSLDNATGDPQGFAVMLWDFRTR